MKAALAFIGREREPFLVHVHLMVTHGPKVAPKNRLFSAGKTQDGEWMDDFYDDAILDFDGHIKNIVEYLEKNGFLDHTIIVVLTDHGQKWAPFERLPLIIRFPGGEHAGRISDNVQYIDLAPTILDYLGLEIPPWMEGASLLSGDMDPMRPIFAASVKDSVFLPIKGMGVISGIICQRYFWMNFSEPLPAPFNWFNVKGHTAPCDEKEIPSQAHLMELLVEHMREKGYDFPR